MDQAARGVRVPAGREPRPRELGRFADLSAVAPAVAGDGTIRFVLRDITGNLYHGNGLFSVHPDGTGWTRLAPLPVAAPDDAGEGWVVDDGLWTDDTSLVLLLPHDARYPIAKGERALLVAGDGSVVTDITPVVVGGAWFTWARAPEQ